MLFSGIIGDPLELIALWPTVPDNGSGWDDVYRELEECGYNTGDNHELPQAVLDLL